MSLKKILLLPLVLILLQLTACATNPVTGVQDIVFMSEQQEIAMGRKNHQQILEEYSVYQNPALQAYVQDVGETLASKSHRNNLIFRFTVLDSKEVNAFALPGGYIYITRGLMAYLNSEAELAAVLGHEVGHVTARHSVRQYSATQLANIGAALGSIFIPGMGTSAGNQMTQLFGAALLRGYSREHELEADRLGAEYLARSGYTPKAMLDVISVLKNQELFERQRAQQEGREPKIYHGVFSTHPDNDKRLKEVVDLANALQSSSTPKVRREPYLTMVDKLVFGDSPKEGITRGNRFYHAKLGFAMQFPKSWNVTNRPDRLIVSAPNGAALMQLSAEDINKRISPRQFMIERLGLNNLSNDSALNIHGHKAYTGTSTINSSFGQRLARFTVIYFKDTAYIMAGMTKDPREISQYDGAFLASMKSFHTITDNERKLARPLRLNIVQAGADTRFNTLATSSPLDKYPEDQLRLMNALYPQGEPRPEQLLKIIK